MKKYPTLNSSRLTAKARKNNAYVLRFQVLTCSLLSILSLSVYSYSPSAGQDSSIHKIAGGAFTFRAPSNWTVDESGLNGVAVIMASPDSEMIVSMSISKVETLSLEDRIQNFKRKVAPPDSLYDDGPAEVGSLKGHSFTLGPVGGCPENRFVIVIKEEKEYDFVLMSKANSFPKADSDFISILKSVTWTTTTEARTNRTKDGSFSAYPSFRLYSRRRRRSATNISCAICLKIRGFDRRTQIRCRRHNS